MVVKPSCFIYVVPMGLRLEHRTAGRFSMKCGRKLCSGLCRAHTGGGPTARLRYFEQLRLPPDQQCPWADTSNGAPMVSRRI